MRTSIDINCDIGERGASGLADDIALLDYVSSVNIACGGHAGDEETMAAIVNAAEPKGIAIGAHPGLADRKNFGRIPMSLTQVQIENLVFEQVRVLQSTAADRRLTLSHVKPHGALYHMAESDQGVAEAICTAVLGIAPCLSIYGRSGGRLVVTARKRGVLAVDEIFGDRAYRSDGLLVARTEPGAVIAEPIWTAKRIRCWLETGTMETVDGVQIPLPGDTICVHSDSPAALQNARAIHDAAVAAGLVVVAPSVKLS